MICESLYFSGKRFGSRKKDKCITGRDSSNPCLLYLCCFITDPRQFSVGQPLIYLVNSYINSVFLFLLISRV